MKFPVAVDDPLKVVPRVSLVHTNIKGFRECSLYVLPYNKVSKD